MTLEEKLQIIRDMGENPTEICTGLYHICSTLCVGNTHALLSISEKRYATKEKFQRDLDRQSNRQLEVKHVRIAHEATYEYIPGDVHWTTPLLFDEYAPSVRVVVFVEKRDKGEKE